MSETKRRTRPEQVKVTFRKMKFGFEDKGFSKYWFDNSPFISFFWDALSTAFPPGEKFFIDSARNLRDQLEDPELKDEIRTFILQEAHHTSQHVKFNQMLERQGIDVAKYEKTFARVLHQALTHLSPLDQLTVTVALEHFTAGFAHQAMANYKLFEGADPEVRALWVWHAAEEAEHKSTCYELYQKIGGGYRQRVRMLPLAWFLILSITLASLFDMLREDDKLLNFRDNLRGLAYLFGFRGLVTKMLPSFIDYLRPDFHPWNCDDSHLIAEWQRENEKYIINLDPAVKPLALH